MAEGQDKDCRTMCKVTNLPSYVQVNLQRTWCKDGGRGRGLAAAHPLGFCGVSIFGKYFSANG